MRFQAGRTISTNFALCEVRTAAYNKQQTHLRSIVVVVMDFIDNKNK
jgi:hypothetical protein